MVRAHCALVKRIALFSLLVATSCAVHKIPGTDIDDTSDTKAILDVMDRYRRALERKDPDAIMKLVAADFHDDAGTSDPSDDLDRTAFQKTLPARLNRIEDISLDISVRKIVVEKDTASAVYYYNERFRLPSLTNRPQSEGDLERMEFRRVGNEWKITRGI